MGGARCAVFGIQSQKVFYEHGRETKLVDNKYVQVGLGRKPDDKVSLGHDKCI